MNSFYDYKKNRYSVLDEVYIGKEPIKFLIKADKEDRYYILDFNDELKSTEKPLRSTFARYDSKVKYDIANLAQEISDTDLMVWEEQKLEIQMQEMSYFDNEKLQQKREEAEEAGWSELSIVDVSYYIENSVLNLSIDGKSFSIQQRIDELAFEELTSNELGDFVREWIYVYNHTIGDMTKAQTSAECEIVAQREFDKLDKSSLTQLDFTKLLVKNLDYSTKFEGWQGEKAFKMCEKLVDYMKDKEIAFASEPTLLGEFGEVGYELRDVLKYYYLYNENGRQEAVKSNIEAQATQFLDERQCLPLSATLGGEKEYIETISVHETENFLIEACKFKNLITGAESYDIFYNTTNQALPFDVKILAGCCNQETLNKMLGIIGQDGKGCKFKPLTNNVVASEGLKKQNQTQM